MKDPRIRIVEPEAGEYLRLVTRNIIYNLLQKEDGSITFPDLIERAYVIVNRTEALPYRDYNYDERLYWK